MNLPQQYTQLRQISALNRLPGVPSRRTRTLISTFASSTSSPADYPTQKCSVQTLQNFTPPILRQQANLVFMLSHIMVTFRRITLGLTVGKPSLRAGLAMS